jgi:hypothetical protein
MNDSSRPRIARVIALLLVVAFLASCVAATDYETSAAKGRKPTVTGPGT